MRPETVRAKLALSLDPTRKITVFSCGSERDKYIDVEALAIAKRAYERLKKVSIASLIVTTKEARERREKRFEDVFSEFRNTPLDYKVIDTEKTKRATLEGLFERALNLFNRGVEPVEGQKVVFILFNEEVNEFFGDYCLSHEYEVLINYFRQRRPDVYFHLSYDTWRSATDETYIYNRELSPHAKIFGVNTIVVYSTFGSRNIVCFPPNPAKIAYFDIGKSDYEMLSLGELLDHQEYERFYWVQEQFHDSYVSFAARQASISGKQGELLAFVLRCLVKYDDGVPEYLFETSPLKGLGEFVHNVPANELLQELWNHTGLFKVVCEQYVLRNNKTPERHRIVLGDVEDYVKSEALKAFEEGRFDSYTDVCIPGVKRDFSYSFCTDHGPKSYTVSFHYQIDD